MAHDIAQFDTEINCSCQDGNPGEFFAGITKTNLIQVAVDEDSVPVTSGPIRARKRRHRRGRNLHKHRLSRHRRARCAKRVTVMGAPRNDNEYLMSQHNAGVNIQESPYCQPHYQYHDYACLLMGYNCLTSPEGQTELVSPRSSTDESTSSSPSDYSSLHNSPSENACYHGNEELIFPHFQPRRTDKFESGCSVLMDGTDARFLQRNFEEEYAENITRSLEEATREELISKCLVLMERLKELEDRNHAATG